MHHLYWLIPALLGISSALLLVWLLMRHGTPTMSFDDVRRQFTDQRAQLHTMFFKVASASGKPRGLRWKECQWSDLIEWVRDKQSGQLMSLVGVTISFEAIEGGDMEGIEAVGNLRNATAVFFFDDEWKTAGRVVFNLNPAEAVAHFKDGYERIE